jgi:hypothetical protein
MMAPQQRVGEQAAVRADVYSVAAVGHELVTGHGVDLAALARLGVENWPHLPLPSSLRAGLATELNEILLHAMAFEREIELRQLTPAFVGATTNFSKSPSA